MSSESPVPSSRRGHPNTRLLFLAVSAGVAAVIAVAAGLGFATYQWAGRQVRYIGEDPSAVSSPDGHQDITGKCVRRACNYLLLGSDSRAGLSKKQQQEFGTNADI